jgi:membrane fusion protein (multidrug efflux system)
MTDSPAGTQQPDPATIPRRATPAWVFTTLRVLAVAIAIYVAWYVAGHWDRWTGAARFETTDDAFISGDVTPLAAKVSGYIKSVAVNDFQLVKKGQLIVEIDPADYNAALVQAQANVSAAQANLTNLANQKDVQRALVRQAEATIDATNADLDRYNLESERQRNLLKSGVAGTPQGVEQADDNAKRTAAQLELNKAQLTQQKAILASLDVEQVQLEAQVRAAKAQAALAQNNVGYTRIVSPVNGLVGQRLVRPGQFVNIGTQVIAVVTLPEIWVIANYKESFRPITQPATSPRSCSAFRSRSCLTIIRLLARWCALECQSKPRLIPAPHHRSPQQAQRPAHRTFRRAPANERRCRGSSRPIPHSRKRRGANRAADTQDFVASLYRAGRRPAWRNDEHAWQPHDDVWPR